MTQSDKMNPTVIWNKPVVLALTSAMHDVAVRAENNERAAELIENFVANVQLDFGDGFSLPDISPELLADKLQEPALQLFAVHALLVFAIKEQAFHPAAHSLAKQYAEALGLGSVFEETAESCLKRKQEGELGPLFA